MTISDHEQINTIMPQQSHLSNLLCLDLSRPLCFLALVIGLVSTAPYESGTVYVTGSHNATYVSGKMDKAGACYGYFNDSLMVTGWGVLEVKTTQKVSNSNAMYAAGYLEGVLTAKQIWLNYVNMRPVFLTGDDAKILEAKYRGYFKQQETWMRNMITKYGVKDPYWRHVGYIVAQYDGLYDGYRSVAEKSWDVSRFVIQFLNSVGDLIDLRHALHKPSRPDFTTMTQAEILRYNNLHGHCSALVKVLPGYENVYMSHDAWFVYAGTMRIYKHYHLNVNDPATAATDMSFSSYPGFLESLDDFYTLSSDMVMLQTTNNVFNMSLYDLVNAQSLLAWQRVRVANMMAHGGEEWYNVVKQYNSGTYNNQYMVIDLKKIRLREAIDNDALWVVEQIPGYVRGADQTHILREGYWASYNVPFYEDIFTLSGYPGGGGLDNTHQMAPRAKIFRRDQSTVSDMKSMKHMMRYNDYENDPYSEDNACNTICCRGDLLDSPTPNGCYDTKISDYNMARSMQSTAINGPTLGDNLKPFSWTGIFEKVSHEGLPNTYNFSWQDMKPVL